jgi:hypothetical protein
MAEQVEQVQIVRINAAVEHRQREIRTITVVIVVVNGVAAAGALVPLVDNLAGALVIGLAVTAALMLMVRWVARRVRWWFEDRADARTAAAWRAAARHRVDSDRVAA